MAQYNPSPYDIPQALRDSSDRTLESKTRSGKGFVGNDFIGNHGRMKQSLGKATAYDRTMLQARTPRRKTVSRGLMRKSVR